MDHASHMNAEPKDPTFAGLDLTQCDFGFFKDQPLRFRAAYCSINSLLLSPYAVVKSLSLK